MRCDAGHLISLHFSIACDIAIYVQIPDGCENDSGYIYTRRNAIKLFPGYTAVPAPTSYILIHVDEILLLMGNTKKFDYSISVGLSALSN